MLHGHPTGLKGGEAWGGMGFRGDPAIGSELFGCFCRLFTLESLRDPEQRAFRQEWKKKSIRRRKTNYRKQNQLSLMDTYF